MKVIGSTLLAGGFLAGSYFTVSQVDSIDLTPYLGCLAVMVVGMVMLALDRKATSSAGSAKHDADIDTLQTSLSNLLATVGGFAEDSSDDAQLQIYSRIDAELMTDIDTFVDARESMIPRLGMQSYADIMSPFANAERLLNRAWSASADGYVDEVRTCVAQAKSELETAQSRLGSARTEPSPA